MGFTYTNVASTTAAVTNRYVVSTNMKVGAYTLANTTPTWNGAALVTVTHTANGTVDTLGTIVVVGVDLAGQTRTDTIVPLNGTVATGTIPFRTITSVTGAGWVIAAGNDTIVVGVADGAIVCGSGGNLHAVVLNNSVAATVVISDSSRTLATIPASQAAGTMYLYDVDMGSYIRVSTSSTNDVTVIHSSTLPATYTP